MKNKRVFWIIPFILFFLLLFQNWFQQEILNSYLIPLVFDRVKPSYALDFFSIVLVFSIVPLYTDKFARRFKPSRLSLLLSVFVIIIYFHYRFLDEQYLFIKSKFCSSLAYGDLALVFGLIYPLLFLFCKYWPRKEKKEFEGGFKEDNPIQDLESDLLGRQKYAKELAQRILNTNNENSFAIGIVGQWGSGKTSFLELIKHNFNKNDLLVLDYNPWNITGDSSITSNFFETFALELENYSSNLSKLIQAYSSKLTQSSKNFWVTILSESINLINHQSKESLYDDINKQLKEIDKQIIIFLDDLDRLDEEEVIEVIKLIRNSANFYRTVFIASYDRKYLLNAIKRINESNYQSFLEKIFQLEITLPRFEEDIIFEQLQKSLKEILDQSDFNNLQDELSDIDYNLIYRSSFTDMQSINIPGYYLKTLRDVTRFINLFSISYSQLNGEVYICDLFYLEILRLKHPHVHRLVFEKSDEFFETSKSGGTDSQKYVLKKKQDQDPGELTKTKLGEYLNSNKSELHLKCEEVEALVLSFRRIFWSGVYDEKNSLSVVFPSNFDKYFSYRLLDGDLSEIEFSRARKLEKDKFVEKIDEWVSIGLDSEVSRKLSNIKNFDDRADFEKVISAIFYFANKESKETNRTRYPIKGFSFRNLYDKMQDTDQRISNKFYSGDPNAYKSFVHKILSMNKGGFNFQIDFLHYLNTDLNIYNFPLDRSERIDFLIAYLEKHLEESSHFDSTTWWIYTTNKSRENGNTMNKVYPEKSKKLLKQFVRKEAVKSYFEFFITKSPQSGKISLGNGVFSVFEDFSTLKKFVGSLDPTPVSDEVYTFLNQLEGDSEIEFNFKELNI